MLFKKDEDIVIEDVKSSSPVRAGQLQALLKTKNLKRVFHINVFVVLRQFTGVFVVTMHAVDIFASTGGSLSPNHCAIILGLVQLVTALSSNLVTDVIGRKSLIIYSGIFMAVSHGVVGVYHFLHSTSSYRQMAQDYLSWMPIVCLVVFIGCFSVGFGPALYIFMVELFPQEVKDTVSSVVLVTSSLGAFAVVQFYYDMEESLGEAGTFWVHGSSCLIAAVYCKCVLPETSGKTLEQIADDLK